MRQATVYRSGSRRRVGGIALSAVALLVALLSAVVLEIRERRSFAIAPPTPPAAMRLVSGAPDAIRDPAIALIGDSWVSRNKLDLPLASSLAELGLSRVRVQSFGQPGAKSKRILQNLFAPDAEEFSSAAVLRDASVRHCIVIAGVNDTAGYIGADFYAHHVIEIARTLLDHGIRPLIVEVPEYGIEHLERSVSSEIKAALFRRLFDGGEVDVVADYRAELERRLVESGLWDRVTLIDFAVTVDYDADEALYLNPSHLNDLGQQRFAHLLAKTVQRELVPAIVEPPSTLRAEGEGGPAPAPEKTQVGVPRTLNSVQRVAAR